MARTRIAPLLTWHIQDPFASDAQAFREAVPQMVRELRAMLAVIRAAEAEVRGWRGIYGSDNLNAHHPLVRALARLSRASQPRAAPSPGEEPR
jgi:hypothetical protein